MKNKKHLRYQDYVINNGQLIGEFEEMYQDFDDPWGQTQKEEYATEKKLQFFICKKFYEKRGK